MDAKRFRRPAITKLVIAGWLTAIVACFAPGQTYAQFVNPVPPTSPTFNPSTPNVVSQPPERPVAPAIPNGLSGPGASPGLNESAPATVIHRETSASASTKSSVSATRGSHRGVTRHWKHEKSYAVRVTGPSYFPGLGIIYPPYPNPCRWLPVWDGAWRNLAYSCS
jgi:hypothetical protein